MYRRTITLLQPRFWTYWKKWLFFKNSEKMWDNESSRKICISSRETHYSSPSNLPNLSPKSLWQQNLNINFNININYEPHFNYILKSKPQAYPRNYYTNLPFVAKFSYWRFAWWNPWYFGLYLAAWSQIATF